MAASYEVSLMTFNDLKFPLFLYLQRIVIFFIHFMDKSVVNGGGSRTAIQSIVGLVNEKQ